MKKTLKKLILEKQVIMPGIYDCISARAVELVGYEAIFLSSRGIANSWCGVPDIGLINADEVLWLASRITEYTQLPLIVTIGNGYSDNNSMTYRTVQRLIKAGADSIVIDDTSGFCGSDRGSAIKVISTDAWLGKIHAAKIAMDDTDCMVIARSYARYQYGLEEAIDRCKKASEIGADITSVAGIRDIGEAKMMASSVAGNKMWSEQQGGEGKTDVKLREIKDLGFCLVSISYTEQASMYGMLDFAEHNLKNGNTVYHDQHDFDGLLNKGEDYHKFFGFHKKWIPLENKFLDVKTICELPNFVKD